jgi:hypothetical protein
MRIEQDDIEDWDESFDRMIAMLHKLSDYRSGVTWERCQLCGYTTRGRMSPC